MTRHDLHTGRVLEAIEAGEAVSQRALSRRVGIALGLTNLIVRRLADRGWIRVVKLASNQARYMITPEGIAAREELVRAHLQDSLSWYTAARARIRGRLAALSSAWSDADATAARSADKRIAFYGAGEVAEIGLMSLHDTDLVLVGVVADAPDGTLLGRPVLPLEALSGEAVDDEPFGRLVVMSFDDDRAIQPKLAARGCPRERQFWI